jgi:polysaccharide export outer membrane protein
VNKLIYKLISLASLLLLVSSCGSNPANSPQIPVGEEVVVEGKGFSFDRPSFNIFHEYRISPGDKLDVLFEIRTWTVEEEYRVALDDILHIKFVNVPELNEEQQVRPDGYISLPYLGSFYVAGKSINQIEEELTREYSRILVSPEIYVTVPQYLTQLRELKKDLHTAPRGLSRLVTVRPDGFVTFPMVGDVFVANKTMSEVQEYVDPQYNKISPSLHVTIFLEQHAGSMVYMLGVVREPGAYEITKPITILEAVALAGGATPEAELDSVLVLRKMNKKIIGTRVDVASSLSLEEGGHQFFLAPDDIVYVPETQLSSRAQVMEQFRKLILFRGWGISLDTDDLDF